MARPTSGYKNAEGQRVPGTTTILGVFGDKGALIYSANRLGLDGKNIRDEWYGKAANIGTLAHDLFEAHILAEMGKPHTEPDQSVYTDEEVETAHVAYGAAVEWLDQTNIRILQTETPLVSEKYQFGGTPDAIGVDSKDRTVILDWKSGGVYGSALFQVAAYKLLVEECLNMKIEGFHVVRFAKETGDFVHRWYPELDKQAEAFPRMRELYTLLQETDKRAR